MKKNNDTLYSQNVQLYTGGFENGPWWDHLFNGYTITTWLVVLNKYRFRWSSTVMVNEVCWQYHKGAVLKAH
ncbi:hypothetical protein HanOQP8_Chr07g0248901 [Helianthus annuus]|nr:hypothetical protein HanOQP8_Chr07g0248901 [Helianthus annuus]